MGRSPSILHNKSQIVPCRKLDSNCDIPRRSHVYSDSRHAALTAGSSKGRVEITRVDGAVLEDVRLKVWGLHCTRLICTPVAICPPLDHIRTTR